MTVRSLYSLPILHLQTLNVLHQPSFTSLGLHTRLTRTESKSNGCGNEIVSYKKMSFHSPPEINARLASGVYNVICIIVRSSADFKIMFLRIETHWDIKYLTRTGEEGGN